MDVAPRAWPEHRRDGHVGQRGLLLGRGERCEFERLDDHVSVRAATRRDPWRPGPLRQHLASEQVNCHGDVDGLWVETLGRNWGEHHGVYQTLLTAADRGVQTR